MVWIEGGGDMWVTSGKDRKLKWVIAGCPELWRHRISASRWHREALIRWRHWWHFKRPSKTRNLIYNELFLIFPQNTLFTLQFNGLLINIYHIIYHWKAMNSLFPMRCQAKRDSHAFDPYSFFNVKSSYSNILVTSNTITIKQNWGIYYRMISIYICPPPTFSTKFHWNIMELL